MKIVRRILTEGLRLWPTGDGAWCHAAVAVTADTPHSEHWAMSCNSWWYLMVSDGTNGVGVSPAQCPAWLRFVLSLVPWEGRAPACSEPQLSLTWVRPSLLHDISAHLVPQCPPATRRKMGQHMRNMRGAVGHLLGVKNNNILALAGVSITEKILIYKCDTQENEIYLKYITCNI